MTRSSIRSTRSQSPGLLRALGLLLLVLCLASAAARAATVDLPAGSSDGLAAALAAAGPGGTVIVKAGLHTESGTVTISSSVTILGEPGAVVESATSPGATYPLSVEAALHVLGTSDVTIQSLVIRPPAGTDGGTGILIEGSSDVVVASNTINAFQFGILVQHGDRAELSGNTIENSLGWLTGAFPEGHGIVNINGGSVRVLDNAISNGLFGIWACDLKGRASGNTVTGNFIGLILCKVPEGNLQISGSTEGSASPAVEWHVHDNNATGNFDAGYLVIDGSGRNRMSNNAASANGTYDIELAGDSFRFGFLTPSSFDNVVAVGTEKNLIIKDCGRNNLVNSPLVDTTLDPCF
jgi:parallel beta-helix repeat protein